MKEQYEVKRLDKPLDGGGAGVEEHDEPCAFDGSFIGWAGKIRGCAVF